MFDPEFAKVPRQALSPTDLRHIVIMNFSSLSPNVCPVTAVAGFEPPKHGIISGCDGRWPPNKKV